MDLQRSRQNDQITLNLTSRQVTLLRRSLFVLKSKVQTEKPALGKSLPIAEELERLDLLLTPDFGLQ